MSKKILSILLALVMVLAMAPVSVFAEDDILNYLTYEIVDGGVTITDCDESISGEVVIPDTIEGYPVTSIGYCAFIECTNLKEITIPDSVTSIGYGAFAYCVVLTSITVDKNNANYSSDEYGVLFNKDKTELIQYPTGNSRTSYIIPDSVTSIGELAFYCCTSLTEITIPDSVKSIGDAAFGICTNLKEITISDSVTSIGAGAFVYCDSLTEVTIPANVTEIGANAFGYAMPNGEGERLLDGFIIYGYAGTAAETYADENGIEFVELKLSFFEMIKQFFQKIIDFFKNLFKF